MDSASIFRNPDDAPVTAIDLRFKILDASVAAHRHGEFTATIWLNVKLAADVGQICEQFSG
jgi:hypothetical protein